MVLGDFGVLEFFIAQGIKIYANAISEQRIMNKVSSRKIL